MFVDDEAAHALKAWLRAIGGDISNEIQLAMELPYAVGDFLIATTLALMGLGSGPLLGMFVAFALALIGLLLLFYSATLSDPWQSLGVDLVAAALIVGAWVSFSRSFSGITLLVSLVALMILMVETVMVFLSILKDLDELF